MGGVQAEAQLERAFVNRLIDLGWQHVKIPDTATMEANLRAQLGTHNGTIYSDDEFRAILNHLSRGSVFDKSKTLRDRMTCNGTMAPRHRFNSSIAKSGARTATRSPRK